MFEISLLLVSWLTIVFAAYRSIRRHELGTAEQGESIPEETPEHERALSQLVGNPYIRMF